MQQTATNKFKKKKDEAQSSYQNNTDTNKDKQAVPLNSNISEGEKRC